jgi:type II secretory pathway component PulF
MGTTQAERPRAFAYEAQTSLGHVFKGTLEAATPDEVHARLSELQLKVMQVSLAAQEAPKRRAMAADEFVLFNQQLAHLTEAGLPVERGLRLIALDLQSGKLAGAAEEVAAELERGVPLQEAFGRHASRFPPLYGRLVEAGVSAGNLPAMLFNLGKHLELVGRLRRSLVRTLAYPLVVMAALSLVLLFISLYVLPHFENMYSGFQIKLPALTRAMIGFAHVYPWFFCIFWGVGLLTLVIDSSMRGSGGRGIPWMSALRYVPFLGKILQSNMRARWVDSLRIGVEAGLDLPRAVALASDAVDDPAMARDARRLAAAISEGSPLSAYRGEALPPAIAASIELASQAGDLPATLRSLSSMYEQQAEHRLQVLPSILMPLLLIVIACTVSLTIAAMFQPLQPLFQAVMGGDI